MGKQGEKQIIATNIDYAFIVQAVDRDFNINRIERYLTICNTSNVKPIIILNKIDPINETELSNLILQVKKRVKQIPVISISNESLEGIEKLKKEIKKGKTYCLLGSSGVGKSTLLNTLSGKQLMKTNTKGGILIDNPGIREVGITNSDGGIEKTFDSIFSLSKECKFTDCTHTTETNCAVLDAVKRGELDRNAYENYLKMVKEKEHFESTLAEKRKKDKDLGKMIKHFKKNRKSDKY